jgi:succinate dehydrogenase / fumarate reductase cytochrome b subunit
MQHFIKVVFSSVGRKFVMAITGLAMTIFLVEHLIGNMMLFSRNPDPYNMYADFLIGLGWLIIAAEMVLIAILLFHVYSAVTITFGKLKARPEDYKMKANAGRASKKTFASSTMIYTGVILFVFLMVHLKTFKFGPFYTTTVEGAEIRDLHRLVWEVFQNPAYVIGYVLILIFMGFHLRHGFWSAFQSLGVSHPKYSPLIYGLGILTAVALSVGFLGIPVFIYIMGV